MTKLYIFFTLVLILLVSLFKNGTHSCPCGESSLFSSKIPRQRNQTVKIIGGFISKPQSWPWVVALADISKGERVQFCGGSIINYNYVLTAAHCVEEIFAKKIPLSNYKILAGDTKIDSPNIAQYSIKSIIMHPLFNTETLNNDIALIKIGQKFKFSDNVRAVCLIQPTSQLNLQNSIVVGWGAVKNGGSTVNSQREVRVRVTPTANCFNRYRRQKIRIYPESMICASGGKNKDSCSGDSGGPLFSRRKSGKAFEQIGIVSFGANCGSAEYPGVYTKLSRYLNFIQVNTRDAQKC